MGTQSPSPKRGGEALSPIFGPFVLWPNGCLYQNATWYRARPRPRRLFVSWRPRSPSPKGAQTSPQFSAHICCGQMAAWIKMSLGMELGLCPGNFVLDGDPALHSPKRDRTPSPIFGPFVLWPNGCMHQDATWYGGRPQPRRLVFDGDPAAALPQKWGGAPNFLPMSIAAKRLHESRSHLVRR